MIRYVKIAEACHPRVSKHFRPDSFPSPKDIDSPSSRKTCKAAHWHSTPWITSPPTLRWPPGRSLCRGKITRFRQATLVCKSTSMELESIA